MLTAESARFFPVQTLDDMISRIEAAPGISRVVFDLTSKPPTEWE